MACAMSLTSSAKDVAIKTIYHQCRLEKCLLLGNCTFHDTFDDNKANQHWLLPKRLGQLIQLVRSHQQRFTAKALRIYPHDLKLNSPLQANINNPHPPSPLFSCFYCFDKSDPSIVYSIYTDLSLCPFNCTRNSPHRPLTKCRSYRLEIL